MTTDNSGTPIGLAAGKIASLRFTAPGVNNANAVTLTNLDTAADLSDARKNPALAVFPAEDFHLNLL